MLHYAEIHPETKQVIRVIVCDSKEWCERRLGGTWVQTFYKTEGKNFAGQGFIYHPEAENFSAPQPYPSWTLDTNYRWIPPVPYPNKSETDSESRYTWNEETLIWDLEKNT